MFEEAEATELANNPGFLDFDMCANIVKEDSASSRNPVYLAKYVSIRMSDEVLLLMDSSTFVYSPNPVW